MWNLVVKEANIDSGLEMNDIGKSFLLLWKSGLTQKQIYVLRLQIGDDLTRFNDL